MYKREKNSSIAYKTECEMEFIRRIGSYGPHAAAFRLSKAELLRGYIAGAKKRHDWGEIDREKIIEYATELLSIYEGGR